MALIKWKQAHESQEYELSSAVHYYSQQLVLAVFQSWRRRYLEVSERADESLTVAITVSERTTMTVAFRKWRRALVRREALKMEQIKLLQKRWMIHQRSKAFGNWKLKVCCSYISTIHACMGKCARTHARTHTHTHTHVVVYTFKDIFYATIYLVGPLRANSNLHSPGHWLKMLWFLEVAVEGLH